MAAAHEVSGLLTAFGAKPTPASLLLVRQTVAERAVRALTVLGACWAAALGAVLIPLAHFILVPGLAVGGLVGAAIRFRETRRLVRIRGICPRCHRAEDFVPAGGGRGQPTVHCPACFSSLLVSFEGTEAGESAATSAP